MNEPQLNFALLCENAFIDTENKLSIIQIFNTIKANSVPATHPKMTIVTNYQFDKDDSDFEFHQSIRIFDPKGQEIANLPIDNKGVKKNTQFLSFFYGIDFKMFGKYTVKIFLNENLVKVLSLELEESE